MSPYREVDHTADWALEVWAPTLEALFADAARGMVELAGLRPSGPERVSRRVELEADDLESLLVSWLQEVLYLSESEGLAGDDFRVDALEPGRLRATVAAGPAGRPEKVIKAVTYHNLQVRQTDQGWTATLVFDV